MAATLFMINILPTVVLENTMTQSTRRSTSNGSGDWRLDKMIIRTSIREPMALPKGDESHLLVQESNDKKLGRIVTRQCSNRVTYQLSINTALKRTQGPDEGAS